MLLLSKTNTVQHIPLLNAPIFKKGSAYIMNGGVRKRGATWSYYFDLGKVDGKRKKKEKGGFKTKRNIY